MTTYYNLDIKPKIKIVIRPTFHFEEEVDLDKFTYADVEKAISEAREQLKKGIEGRDLLHDINVALVWVSDIPLAIDSTTSSMIADTPFD